MNFILSKYNVRQIKVIYNMAGYLWFHFVCNYMFDSESLWYDCDITFNWLKQLLYNEDDVSRVSVFFLSKCVLCVNHRKTFVLLLVAKTHHLNDKWSFYAYK
jgi:hypothetical protein